MKRLTLTLAVIAGLMLAVPTFAQVGQGLSGPHYNLNIIGVSHPKTTAMDLTDRHTLFVPLSGSVKISYVAGTEFQVLDGTGRPVDRINSAPARPLGSNGIPEAVAPEGAGLRFHPPVFVRRRRPAPRCRAAAVGGRRTHADPEVRGGSRAPRRRSR